jgi:hypothetical protein
MTNLVPSIQLSDDSLPELERNLMEVEVVGCNPTAGTNKSKNEDDITHEINIDKDILVCFFCWL